MPADVPVKNWMSGDPVVVAPAASAVEALDLMLKRGIRHLPVVDDAGVVVGVLSFDDLRAGLPVSVARNTPLSPPERDEAREWSVADVMTHGPHTIGEDASLAEAAQRMARERIGCLPVVDAEQRLAGILSETDVLQALATSLWTDEVRADRGGELDLDRLLDSLRRERRAITERLGRSDGAEQQLSAQRLAGIDRALAHATQGRLGVCDGCGGPISLARLRALPGATLCIACARADGSEGG
ncbi:MAG: CBS domain-containing protein [Myxococcota bacterium]|nr:CBS domain-containing protein [Myxococcota bacterium]